MNRKRLWQHVCCVLVAALAMGMTAAAFPVEPAAQLATRQAALSGEEEDLPGEEETQPSQQEGLKKSETVYVTLDASGNPRQRIVTDRISGQQAGQLLQDYTTLDEVTVIKGGQLVSQEGGQILWQADGEGEALYYQGSTDQELPLEVQILYTLDGQPIEPAQLAGRSGSLQMEIHLKNCLRQAVQVGEKTVEMCTPMTVAIGMALPEDVFSQVQLSEGSLVGDGNNQMAMLLAMPGLEESLALKSYDLPGVEEIDFPESFTITAQVQDFEMGSIGLAVYTGLPDLDFDDSDIDRMRTDLGDLEKMQNDLEQMDGDRRIRSIYTDPWMTVGAQTLVDDIFSFYDLDKALLEILPDYVTDQNIQLYDRIRKKSADLDIEEMLFGNSAHALYDFADHLDVRSARRLAEDAQSLAQWAGQYRELLASENLMPLLQAAALLGEAAQEDPGRTAALLDLAGLVQPDQLEELWQLYQASGLGAIQEEQLQQLEKAAGFLHNSGLEAIAREDPEFLDHALTGMENGITQLVQQTGGQPLSQDEWQLMISAGLQAVAQQRQQVYDSGAGGQVYDSGAGDGAGGTASDAQPALDLQAAARLLAAMRQLEGQAGQKLQEYGVDPGDPGQLRELAEGAAAMIGQTRQLMAQAARMGQEEQEAAEQLGILLAEVGDGTLQQMVQPLLRDLALNERNIGLLQTLLEECDLDVYTDLLYNSGSLYEELDRAYTVLSSLKRQLDRPEINASLHSAPETTATLMKMKDDLEEYRQVSEALREAVQEENAQTFRQMIATLDRLEGEGAVERYRGQADDLRELIDRKDAYAALAEENAIFTDAPAGFETEVAFVMKTDSIQKPEEPEVETAAVSKSWWEQLWEKVKK